MVVNRGYQPGFEYVKTEYLIVLNADAELKEGCLHELLKPLNENEATLTILKVSFMMKDLLIPVVTSNISRVWCLHETCRDIQIVLTCANL